MGDPGSDFQGTGLLAEVHEELSNLVGIHAGSRYLDRACPVEIVVAQVKGQLLDRCLLNGRVVEWHIEVGGKDTALSGELRNQVEIILSGRVLILNDLGVNQTT